MSIKLPCLIIYFAEMYFDRGNFYDFTSLGKYKFPQTGFSSLVKVFYLVYIFIIYLFVYSFQKVKLWTYVLSHNN